MGWGDSLTLSEIGYESFPARPPPQDFRASGAVVSWARTEKAEDK